MMRGPEDGRQSSPHRVSNHAVTNVRSGAAPGILRHGSERVHDRAVLLLPGLGSGDGIWDLVASDERLNECVDILFGPAVAQRPFANNDQLRPIPALGAVLADELDRLPYSTYVVAAHSLGTFVALDIGRRLSARVTGIVLVNGGLATAAEALDRPLHTFRRHPAITIWTTLLLSSVCLPVPVGVKDMIARHQSLSRLVLGPWVSGEVVADIRLRRDVLSVIGHPELFRGILVNRHHWQMVLSEADSVVTPIWLLAGDEDPIARASSVEEFASLFPRCAVRSLHGSHHAIPLERPSAVLEAIQAAQL
jgi:pimeloyl-ACP methyl ester carboxylesterase